MDKIKLGVLVGGTSIEREVSKKSCENLLANLDENKYDITVYHLPADGNTEWAKNIISNPPQIVLSALHGGNGENGSIQGFLHCLNIPYIGSKVLSSAICMNKAMAKTVMKANHIQVPDHVFVMRGVDFSQYEESIKLMGFPLIVKPNRGGSSIGVIVARNMEDIHYGIKNIMETYDDDVLIEKFIDGKEINCCVLQGENGPEAMAVLDVKKASSVFVYDDKYHIDEYSSDITSLPDFMQDMIKSIAVKTFNVLQCKGYACVDMIVQEEQIYVIEVNTLPGLTSHSLIHKATKNLDFSFGEFLDKLINFELKK